MAFPILSLVLFLISLFFLVKGADFAVKHASGLAKAAGVSQFMASVLVVSVISTFPEATVAIVSAFKGVPEFGLGTLLGSNVADLTLVFGIAALFSIQGIKVKGEILRHDVFYLVLFLMPSLLGFDGKLSRLDGIILVLSGLAFFAAISLDFLRHSEARHSKGAEKIGSKRREISMAKSSPKSLRDLLFLLASLGVLLASAYSTVKFGVEFAEGIGVPSFFVALTVVAIGTCLPELVFSIKAVGKGNSELALGDVLGTVVIDSTILVGILALINPFEFSPKIVYVTGALMALSGLLAIDFMRSGRLLTRKEGVFLIIFYILTLLAEIFAGKIF